MKTSQLTCLIVAAYLIASASLSASVPATIDEKAQSLLSQWRERFDAEDLRYTVGGPFVIGGDASAARLKEYRDNTILAAMRALNATYFNTDPSEPVLILLFENAESYQRLAKKWFGDDDVPHYGFFRRSDHTMLMNVGTGTGTLVHELVHALIAPDFPDVPDWFNEGLASLYEQCSIHGDAIRGHENWRLGDLQEAIEKDQLRTLRQLVEDAEFYNDAHVGMNYAQARYLLMYLQEKDLLKKYYQDFRENIEADPTGLKTLEKTIAPSALEQFEADWRKWVITLKFEP